MAIVTVLLSFGVITPAAQRLVHLTEEATKNPGPPPADLQKASNRLRVAATLALAVLMLVLVCMVAAAEL